MCPDICPVYRSLTSKNSMPPPPSEHQRPPRHGSTYSEHHTTRGSSVERTVMLWGPSGIPHHPLSTHSSDSVVATVRGPSGRKFVRPQPLKRVAAKRRKRSKLYYGPWQNLGWSKRNPTLPWRVMVKWLAPGELVVRLTWWHHHCLNQLWSEKTEPIGLAFIEAGHRITLKWCNLFSTGYGGCVVVVLVACRL